MSAANSPFCVPAILDFLGGLVQRHRDFWLWLGRLESSALSDATRQIPLSMPIYISGLARSGSTLLHEIISSHPSVATHRTKDYPMLFTPYW
jgi:Sulfotransferase family